MQIGGIGSVGFSPYVYNANSISRASLNPIAALPEDGTRHSVDYTGLVSEEARNENPLKKGTSANFADIIASQMSMSQYHQTSLMTEATQPAEKKAQDSAGVVVEDLSQNESTQGATSFAQTSDDKVSYRMNQALEAYNFQMGIA